MLNGTKEYIDETSVNRPTQEERRGGPIWEGQMSQCKRYGCRTRFHNCNWQKHDKVCRFYSCRGDKARNPCGFQATHKQVELHGFKCRSVVEVRNVRLHGPIWYATQAPAPPPEPPMRLADIIGEAGPYAQDYQWRSLVRGIDRMNAAFENRGDRMVPGRTVHRIVLLMIIWSLRKTQLEQTRRRQPRNKPAIEDLERQTDFATLCTGQELSDMVSRLDNPVVLRTSLDTSIRSLFNAVVKLRHNLPNKEPAPMPRMKSPPRTMWDADGDHEDSAATDSETSAGLDCSSLEADFAAEAYAQACVEEEAEEEWYQSLLNPSAPGFNVKEEDLAGSDQEASEEEAGSSEGEYDDESEGDAEDSHDEEDELSSESGEESEAESDDGPCVSCKHSWVLMDDDDDDDDDVKPVICSPVQDVHIMVEKVRKRISDARRAPGQGHEPLAGLSVAANDSSYRHRTSGGRLAVPSSSSKLQADKSLTSEADLTSSNSPGNVFAFDTAGARTKSTLLTSSAARADKFGPASSSSVSQPLIGRNSDKSLKATSFARRLADSTLVGDEDVHSGQPAPANLTKVFQNAKNGVLGKRRASWEGESEEENKPKRGRHGYGCECTSSDSE